MEKRKELTLAYKQKHRPMGVYQIKNHRNGKILVGSSMNLPGAFNRHRFQLNFKVHCNKALQADWDLNGSDAFSFDILEVIKSEEIPEYEWRKAVAVLEEKWLNTLQPYDENGYNKPKKSR